LRIMADTQLLAGSDESKVEQRDAFIFEKTYREVGVRVRVDELSYISTATQRYGCKLLLDRSWEASKNDLRQWKALRNGEIEEKGVGDYKPEYTPFVNFANSVSANGIPQPWEQTGGLHIIMQSDMDQKYYNRYKIKGEFEFTEEFEVQNYPFDLQDLSIVVTPESSSIEEQRLVPHHFIDAYFTVNDTWSCITDWDIVGLFTKEYIVDTSSWFKDGKKSLSRGHESWVNYKIQVKRKWRGVLLRVVLWMFLLGLLSFCIFSHDHANVEGRLAFGITMVLTIVAFQFVITASLPQVNYLTLMDEYNLFVFLLNCVFIIESAVIGLQFNEKWAETADLVFIGCGVLSFVAGHITFAIVCSRANSSEWDKLGKVDNLKVQYYRQTNGREAFADKSHEHLIKSGDGGSTDIRYDQ